MASGGQVIGLLAIAGVVGFFLARPNSGTEVSGTDVDPENTLNDIMRNKTFLAANPDFPEITRKLIAANGYECRRIAILWVKGQSPLGTKLEAFCGPAGSTGIYEAQHYAVYPERLSVAICKPSGIFGSGCD